MADAYDPDAKNISKLQRLWPLLIAGLIFAASHRSHIAAPGIKYIDKIGHFGVYGLLATLLCRLGSGWRAGWWALLAVSLYGVSDEWHQSFVPGRSTEVADWVADTAGGALAVGLYWGWAAYRRWLETTLWPRRRVAPSGVPVPARQP